MKKEGAFLWWIALVFLLLAASFIFDLWGSQREVIEHSPVEEAYFTKEPVRDFKQMPLTSWQGVEYDCLSCHAQMEVPDVHKSFYSAHRDVILNHGVNNDCKTCHSQTNKNLLVDGQGRNIAFDQSAQTCLKCHGPIYRDWENGVHGRMKDYWDPAKKVGTQKLTCVQCHNPHDPKFASMKPSPPPHRYQYQDELKHAERKTDIHE